MLTQGSLQHPPYRISAHELRRTEDSFAPRSREDVQRRDHKIQEFPMKRVAEHHLAWNIFDQAIAYLKTGLSVIPLQLDGSKSPACSSWKLRQCKLPELDELQRDFSRPRGIGIVCGKVSGGLEIIDFDDAELFDPWLKQVRHIAGCLPVVRTPKGFHVYYRCAMVSPNKKIADRIGREQAAIETRGEGGYVVAVGSPPTVHHTGKTYEQISGPSLPRPLLSPSNIAQLESSIPILSEQERATLWSAARSFDQNDTLQRDIARYVRRNSGVVCERRASAETPWGDFDLRGPSWQELLEPHGWTTRDGVHWLRPGKFDSGHSAAVRMARTGGEVLVVWSTSAGRLAPTGTTHRTLGKFEAYTELFHQVNRRAAAKEIARNGFGGSER